MTRRSTRDHIVQTADRLFYEKGFEATSFADIAEAVGISRGNFYHHFKKKDDILEAVIELRLANTQAMLDCWEEGGDDPLARILSFIRILIANRAKIMAFGCPVGTLSAELAKLDHAAHQRAASIFKLFGGWLAEQFRRLGRGDDAEALALRLLARSQGVAAIAAAFRDEAFIRSEVAELEIGSTRSSGHPSASQRASSMMRTGGDRLSDKSSRKDREAGVLLAGRRRSLSSRKETRGAYCFPEIRREQSRRGGAFCRDTRPGSPRASKTASSIASAL